MLTLPHANVPREAWEEVSAADDDLKALNTASLAQLAEVLVNSGRVGKLPRVPEVPAAYLYHFVVPALIARLRRNPRVTRTYRRAMRGSATDAEVQRLTLLPACDFSNVVGRARIAVTEQHAWPYVDMEPFLYHTIIPELQDRLFERDKHLIRFWCELDCRFCCRPPNDCTCGYIASFHDDSLPPPFEGRRLPAPAARG